MSDRIGKAILEISIDAAGINKGITDIKGQLSGLTGTVGAFGKVLAGAFTVTAIAALGKQVLDFAGELTDLSKQTGVSTTTLQKWSLAFEQSGVSIETVTKAAGELANKLVGGDKSAVAAVEKLGLNVEALKRMSPEQQFNTVADAVGNIQNKGEQLYASKTLFGKGGVELLKGLTGSLEETTAEFENLGLVMDEETVAAADEFGDKIGLMGTQLLALVATIIGPLLPALSGLMSILLDVGKVVGDVAGVIVKYFVAALVSASSAIMNFLALILEAATKIPFLGKHLGVAGDAAEWLRSKAKDADTYLVKMFTSTDAVGASAQATAPKLIGLGGATEKAGKAAKEAADAYHQLHEAQSSFASDQASVAGYFQTMMPQFQGVLQAGGGGTGVTGLSRLINEAAQSGAGVMSLFSGPQTRGMVSQGVSQGIGAASSGGGILSKLGGLFGIGGGGATSGGSGGGGGGFLSTISGLFGGGGGGGGATSGILGKVLGGVGGSMGIVGSLFGGGSGEGQLSSKIGGAIGSVLGSVIPGLGTMLGGMAGQFLGPFVGKGITAIKGLFGGPDKTEKEGRAAAQSYRQGLIAELSPEQMKEVAEATNGAWAGNEAGAATVIKVRDAYVAAGKSAEEALTVVERLFRAEKGGGEEVAAVIAEIQAVFEQGATPAVEEFGDTAVEAFEKTKQAAAELAAQMRRSYGGDNDSEAGGGSIDFNPMMFDEETGSYVPATYERWVKKNPGANEGDFRKAFNLDVIAAAKAAGLSEEQLNRFARDNGDVHRIGRAFNLPGFATGGIALKPTAGIFGEAGPEALVPLDRYDQQMQRGEDLTLLQRGLDALKGEMAGIRRDFQDMPRRMMHAALTVR